MASGSIPPRPTMDATTDWHEEDRNWLKELKTIDNYALYMRQQFQCCERWRKSAVDREMKRRGMPT